MTRADTALYFAKAHGRNQSRQYEALYESPHRRDQPAAPKNPNSLATKKTKRKRPKDLTQRETKKRKARRFSGAFLLIENRLTLYREAESGKNLLLGQNLINAGTTNRAGPFHRRSAVLHFYFLGVFHRGFLSTLNAISCFFRHSSESPLSITIIIYLRKAASQQFRITALFNSVPHRAVDCEPAGVFF